MKHLGILLILFAPFALAEGASHDAHVAEAPVFDRAAAIETSRAALGRLVSDHAFQDETGQRVTLGAYRDKPLVISLIFTSCHHICPTTTRHLDEVVQQARAALGDDTFNVITIGFDTLRDTPPMMRQFAVQQGVDDPRWRFLSGDQQTVDSLVAELGFQYFPAGSGFDHLIQTSLVDAEGRVYRQVYGMQFDPPLLVEPLKRFAFGVSETDSLLEAVSKQVRLFCTVYDPSQERYTFDYSLFIGTFIAVLCVAFVGINLVREWRKTLAAK